MKIIGAVGQLGAGLGGVRAVVEPDAEHVPRRRDGRAEHDVGQFGGRCCRAKAAGQLVQAGAGGDDRGGSGPSSPSLSAWTS